MPDESERKNHSMNVEYDTVGFGEKFLPCHYTSE
jgi:hypothetical protein